MREKWIGSKKIIRHFATVVVQIEPLSSMHKEFAKEFAKTFLHCLLCVFFKKLNQSQIIGRTEADFVVQRHLPPALVAHVDNLTPSTPS